MKRLARILVGLFLVLLAFEVVVRFKYYFDHHRDTAYLVMPFGRPLGGAATEGGERPCRSLSFVDERRQVTIHRTYNSDCMRTMDSAGHGRTKPPGVFRILMVGNSTVSAENVDDAETVPAVLETLLNAGEGPTPAIQVLNAGFSGATSRELRQVVDHTVFAYHPDLILLYSGFNDARPDPWVDQQIGAIGAVKRWAKTLHDALYYDSMAYTYVVEKYYFMAQRHRVEEVVSNVRVRPDFEENLRAIIASCRAHGVPLIVLKPVIRSPVTIDLIDTLDHDQIEALYARSLASPAAVAASVDSRLTINQRYVTARMEMVARQAAVPVIDFVRAFDREVPKEYFLDIVHQRADGNRKVARYIADALKGRLGDRKTGRRDGSSRLHPVEHQVDNHARH